MGIWQRICSMGRSFVHAVHLRNQRAAARHMLELSSERLADIGLTKYDIHRAIESREPLEVIYAARDKHAREKQARKNATLRFTKGMEQPSAPHRPQGG